MPSHSRPTTPVVVLPDVAGNLGNFVTGLVRVGSAEVRLPALAIRQFEMLRSLCSSVGEIPNRLAMNCSCEVWSKASEHTQPPALKGDTTSMGTRIPKPIGPVMPPASGVNGRWVTYSPG